MDTIVSLIIVIVGAWLLDLLLGDPLWLPHPIVYMGKWISFCEHRLNHGRHRKLKGAIFAVASIALLFSIVALLFHLMAPWSLLQIGLSVVAAFFCLAGRTLRSEVRMVFEALDRSLDEGRRQVARIVGRDTQQLTAQEVRKAALETLAENLSDVVVAPLFWFAILGIPGMLTYKLINTMDSMIGYKTDRYRAYGCWAAHIDDIANFIPARLTALLMILVSPLVTAPSVAHLFSFTIRYARNHASPNSGWPEAALAGILNCQFGGTHNYFGQSFYKPYIGTNDRLLTTDDMRRSIRLCFMAEVLAVVLVAVTIIAISWISSSTISLPDIV